MNLILDLLQLDYRRLCNPPDFMTRNFGRGSAPKRAAAPHFNAASNTVPEFLYRSVRVRLLKASKSARGKLALAPGHVRIEISDAIDTVVKTPDDLKQ